MADNPQIHSVLLTGATGFVGRTVLRELVARGFRPVCLVRDAERLEKLSDGFPIQPKAIAGSLFDPGVLREAVSHAQSVIHLVGIIMERRLAGQTFDRIHREGTERVIAAARSAGVRRFVHMSALGTRDNAVSRYHQTKYQAEEIVRRSGLDWTIFRPSLIHGPDGEFMRLMGRFAAGLIPPVMPYFGSGNSRIQPVSVKDVATCFVKTLSMPETVGKTYELGGPDVYTWKQLYALCKRLIPQARSWKPIVSLPVPLAKLAALTVMKTPLVPEVLKFNVAQVQMSQEDSVCDHQSVESAFGFKLRRFEEELSLYGIS